MSIEASFTQDDRLRLRAAVERRYSCRSYAQAPTLGDWAALSYAAGRCESAVVRLPLLRVEPEVFGEGSGAAALAAVVVRTFERNASLLAGFAGERLCLEAAAMGLASCWVNGNYRRRMLNLTLARGESLSGVIALGYPMPGMAQPLRCRKPMEAFTLTDASRWRSEAREAARLVRLSPSAMNAQPWQMDCDGEAFSIFAEKAHPLETGIAVCHAELALTTPHEWRFAQRPGDASARAVWKQ